MTAYYKGFSEGHLEDFFEVQFGTSVIVPYYGINGAPYREKRFNPAGQPLSWIGDPKPQIPYGMETLQLNGDVAFLTEGESCSWALRTQFPRVPVLGLPGASSWREEWARVLRRFPVIYLSFDADEAGAGLTDTVWPSLPWARRVKLPEGTDTRDVLQLRGAEAYERLLGDADYIAACTRFILETPIRQGASHAV